MRIKQYILTLLTIISINIDAFSQEDMHIHPVDSICLSNKVILDSDQVDQTAMPSNGFMKFREEVNLEINMPISALENGIAGRVTLEFVICATGQITDVDVIHSKGEDCDQEAIRVLNIMGKWTPALKNNEAVSSKVRYSFNFRKK